VKYLQLVKKDITKDAGQESFELYKDICQDITTAFSKIDFAICSSRFLWKTREQRCKKVIKLLQDSKNFLENTKLKVNRLIEINKKRLSNNYQN